MRTGQGRVLEVILSGIGALATKITCAPGLIPAPGQYLLAHDACDEGAALGVPLFPSDLSKDAFRSAPPAPAHWLPGMRLSLRGPFGRGFHLPAGTRRLALAALGETADRLLPLARQVLELGGDVILFADIPFDPLPSPVEFFPLASLIEALPEALPWADYLALDVPLAAAGNLRQRLGLAPGTAIPCPGQALVLAPMPCAGQAACGACAVRLRQGWRLACEDGPVFDLTDLIGERSEGRL
jgi:dihydroorotate dehydrogenase electron transfer subunit